LMHYGIWIAIISLIYTFTLMIYMLSPKGKGTYLRGGKKYAGAFWTGIIAGLAGCLLFVLSLV